MISQKISECLSDRTGSYLIPLLWYAGENAEQVRKEMDAIRRAGISEFIFENRGGDWFCTEPWMRLFEEVLQYAAACRMRVWLLDDSHVNTGSANDSLKRPENAPFRQQCLRIELMDVVGPVSAGAVFLPEHTAAETILAIAAYRRDERSGECIGAPVDLSGNIKDGLCMLDLPAGIWRIYFVMTADPARQGMFANYITMVSASSCRHLIDEVHEKIHDRFSAYFGTVFAGFFSDEPAFGNCDGQYGDDYAEHRMGQLRRLYPWNADVARLLAARCRMTENELVLRLPALWDAVSPGDTALRLAYMDLITGLWRENYSCRLGDWCEQHGVEYIGHVLEDEGAHMRTGWGCGHFFRAMAGQHMAGIDTVLGQTIPGITSAPHALNQGTLLKNTLFYQYTMPKLAVSLARHNPRMRGRSICEIFGAYGWNAGLSFMRAILNFHLASGVNHYIPHAYSMCLPEVFRGNADEHRNGGGFTPPGYCMSYLAPAFYAGGFNPQYGIFCKLMRYAQRVCHLLAGGEHLADIAIYYNAEGDWVNQGAVTSLDEVCAALTRGGFDYDILPADTLLRDAEAENSRLRVGPASYGALIVPGSTVLPEKLLERFEVLAAQGVPLLFAGILPERTEEPDSPAMASLPGNLYAVPVPALAERLGGISPGRLRISPAIPELRYFGMRGEDGAIYYFFCNEGRTDARFQVAATQNAVLYDPWGNRLFRLTAGPDGLRLTVRPQELLVVVFNRDEPGLPLFLPGEKAMRELPLRYRISLREAGNAGTFRVIRENSEAVNLTVAENLTRFCGEIRYEAEFDWTGASAETLVIPECGDCAELWLNGSYCGAEIGPQCRFEIGGKLKPGRNTLLIRTADNPAYADRPTDGSGVPCGRALPLCKHGFTGNVFII